LAHEGFLTWLEKRQEARGDDPLAEKGDKSNIGGDRKKGISPILMSEIVVTLKFA
jgi:hypothetical protein